jgi:hypothetical protein
MVEAAPALSELYLADETAWLDAMADLIRSGSHSELDYANLAEYLHDMASRDRKMVKSRLKQLLLHILKYTHQPEKRTPSWQGSILDQQQELEDELDSGTLRNHAEAILEDAYRDAVKLAAKETGLPEEGFPAECPYTLDELLAFEAAD